MNPAPRIRALMRLLPPGWRTDLVADGRALVAPDGRRWPMACRGEALTVGGVGVDDFVKAAVAARETA